jgi:hypothetical protein
MPKSVHHQIRDKNMKKKPLLSPKEKRAVKHAKKHMHDVQPLIPSDTTH